MTEQQDNDWRTRILAPFEGDLAGRRGSAPRCHAEIPLLPAARRTRRGPRRGACERERSGRIRCELDALADGRTLATEALQTRTKDIEIAAWLTESLTRHDGLAGLAEGAAILTGLIAQFWDAGLFPTADPAEPGERLMPIGGLSGAEREGSLLQPLRKTVLFQQR